MCSAMVFGEIRLRRKFAASFMGLFALMLSLGALGKRPVHVYTFSDIVPHPGLCALAEATWELGGILRVLGLSKTPGYILIHGHSPTLKFLMLQDMLEFDVSIGRVQPNDLVIFVDGHDVYLQRPLRELVEEYEKFPGSPFLISGERNCWPWPHTDPSHGEWDPGMDVQAGMSWTVNRWLRLEPKDFCHLVVKDGPYPFPNIGSSMGPVSRMLEVLKRNNRFVIDEDVNDQGAMWLVIFRHAEELNIQIDQHARVFMNMLAYPPGEFEREPCAGWFDQQTPGSRVSSGRARGPPRNRRTNTTPSILHFNGPSHEDDRWLECYHAFTEEFRALGRGQALFDVDHNVMLSLDSICDYSWYNIRNFHAHPMNEDLLRFLEKFRAMPLDPRIVAWRGNASAVDNATFGLEADLHANSPHLKRVLGSGL